MGDWERQADLASCKMKLISLQTETVTIIFEVGTFCSEDIRKPKRSHFADLMNKAKCLEGYVIGRVGG